LIKSVFSCLKVLLNVKYKFLNETKKIRYFLTNHPIST
jgi:hypothetical protein